LLFASDLDFILCWTGSASGLPPMLSRIGSGTLNSPSAGASSAGASSHEAASAGEAIEDDDDDEDDDEDDELLSDSESGVSEPIVASESVNSIGSEV
jgi:hypothetical protein